MNLSISANKFKASLTAICTLTLMIGVIGRWTGWVDEQTIQVGNDKLFNTSQRFWQNGIQMEAEKYKSTAKTVIYVVVDDKPPVGFWF